MIRHLVTAIGSLAISIGVAVALVVQNPEPTAQAIAALLVFLLALSVATTSALIFFSERQRAQNIVSRQAHHDAWMSRIWCGGMHD
jgi:hypothetical protein